MKKRLFNKSKKKNTFVMSVLLVVAMMVSVLVPEVTQQAGMAEAAGNPYPKTYVDDKGVYHPGNCTYQAWEEAYNRLGVALPSWGNAGNWCKNAKKSGYQVIDYSEGKIPPANCIIQWSGHVGWCISADAVGVNIREGNILLNGSYKAVHEQWWSWATLKKYRGNPVGFIVLNKGVVGNNPQGCLDIVEGKKRINFCTRLGV